MFEEKEVMCILKKINLMIFGMVILMAWALSSSLFAADEEIVNLVIGGDFEEDNDMNNWSLHAAGGAATMERDKKESAVGDVSLMYEVDKIDPAAVWNPQFRQSPYGTAMTAEKGTYTLSVFLKAEVASSVLMMIFSEVPAYTIRFQKNLSIGTDWEEYWATGTVPEDAQVAIRFTTFSNECIYWFDNLRFYEGEYVPTETEGEKSVVVSSDKVITAWGDIKAKY
jgi:hypothetical protein